MKALRAYVAQQNDWRKIWGEKALDLDNAADRQKIGRIIDSALSPENLSCDGELPMSEVNRRYRELTSAARDLLKMDPTVVIHEY